MKDIVERLRFHIAIRGGPAKDDDGNYVGTTWPMMLEAADEIERQRKALVEINSQAVCAAIATEGECYDMLQNCAEISDTAITSTNGDGK